MKAQPIDTVPDDKHVLLLIDNQWIEGWWSTEKNDYEHIWLPNHSCGCCACDNPDPTHWAELPTVEEA